MGDSYKEILIKRKTPASAKLMKGALIALTALCIVGGLLIWPLMAVGVALLIVCFFVVPRFEVEFEYLYVNGELDIDAIYSRQKRKKQGTYDMAELEMLAPSGSHALDPYVNQQGAKIKDFTSLDPQAKTYVLVMNQDKGRVLIRVELDDEIIHDIRRIAPRKVSQY